MIAPEMRFVSSIFTLDVKPKGSLTWRCVIHEEHHSGELQYEVENEGIFTCAQKKVDHLFLIQIVVEMRADFKSIAKDGKHIHSAIIF